MLGMGFLGLGGGFDNVEIEARDNHEKGLKAELKIGEENISTIL